MHFDSIFKDRFRTQLNAGFDDFAESSLTYSFEHLNSYQRVALENLLPKYPPFGIDQNQISGFINKSRQQKGAIELKDAAGDTKNWYSNDIVFPFVFELPQIPEWGSDNFWEYRNWRNELEFQCQEEFIKESIRVGHLDFVWKLPIFDDYIFGTNKPLQNPNGRRFQYNNAVWLEYVDYITVTNFNDFSVDEQLSNRRYRRFSQEIHKGVELVIEYDIPQMIGELNRGQLCLPDHFKIFIINTNFKKKGFLVRQIPGCIMQLGILGNPYFHHPCYPLLGYSAVDSDRKATAGESYHASVAHIGDDRYQLINPVAYGKSMTTHGLFYMSMLASTSKLYLNYIIRSVKNCE